MRLLLPFVPFLLASALHAQGTGTLAGRVLYDATGEGLPGANVIVVGTQLGAATDIDGNYRIIGIPVGQYAVTAPFLGFQEQTVDAVQVSSGRTTWRDFKLNPGAEVPFVIVRHGPSINRDPFTSRIVTGDEIARMPVGR